MTFKEHAILAMELLLKQPPVTFKQAKEQTEMLRRYREQRFAKEAPEIQSQLKQIQTPLNFTDVVHIYRWLFRKQITIEMLPKSVLKEFKKTELYSKFIKIK